jgi:hypothetical protein
MSISPFAEYAQFEQGNSEDSFYATGSVSEIGNDPGSFSSALSNKEQIRISFPVNAKTQMLPNSSSIYYFNTINGTWNIPEGARTQHSGTFQNFSYRTTWLPASGTLGGGSTLGTKFLEDYKAFDPYGRSFAVGDLNIYRQVVSRKDYNQTISGLVGLSSGSKFDININGIVPFMMQDYKKSVQRTGSYDAQHQECFELNVNYPFLIEKISLDVPILLGETWFKDYTVSTVSYATGTYAGTQPIPAFYYFDRGGPGITVSLMCQKKYGEDLIRDLIASKTMTHTSDSIGANKSRLYPLPYSEGGGKKPFVIIDSYGLKDSDSFLVDGNSINKFTGSVNLKLTPSISNGSNSIFSTTFYVTGSIDPIVYSSPQTIEGWPPWKDLVYDLDSFLKRMRTLFSKKTVTIEELGGATGLLYENKFLVNGIDAFGRGMTGFSPSGGSIFGKEYVSSQNPNILDNPFYLKDSSLLENSINQISSSIVSISSSYPFSPPQFDTIFVNLVGDSNFFYSKKDSPYLVNPGDKLILTISKTRPAISSSTHNVPNALYEAPNTRAADVGYQNLVSYSPLTGSVLGHDVCLNTGSINITFYGSYVRAGNSYIP